ncbi:uncharacterized protein LOC110847167 [Folsomia candida]|uniref:uncharacterized protein LOC110847167 n=1 Tax=Folsomia candida TaxID=158441 RepID=UPI000B909913|nr:uncharacterized protein LOC110847167 [Folsomia candida]
MKDILIYSCFFSQIFLLVKAGRTVNNTLKCYQCDTFGKNPGAICPEEDLKTCPNNIAADRCLTRVTKNATGYYVVRKCALAPCELPDGLSSSLFKLSSNCDRDRDEFTCYTCCVFDGCNLNSAIRMGYLHWSVLLITMSALMILK